jgi:hypothetical protein
LLVPVFARIEGLDFWIVIHLERLALNRGYLKIQKPTAKP